MKAIPTTVEGDKAKAGNGAYVFTVDSMGRYYTFQTGGKFLATNNEEELFLLEPNADGSAPETAKWFLQQKSDGYLLYNKEASYNGTPVCIEYYSSVFSGWTYSTKNDVNIYLFNFYKLADGTKVYADIVQDPTVKFDGEDVRYIEQDYAVEASLDDLSPEIIGVKFTYTVGGKTGDITNVSGNERTYSLTIPAAELDRERGAKSFTVQAQVTNSYGITYTGEKTVQILDEPFFSDLTPRANSQTGENKRPEVRVKIGNVGANPTITMQLNGKDVQATFADGVLTYTPAAPRWMWQSSAPMVSRRKRAGPSSWAAASISTSSVSSTPTPLIPMAPARWTPRSSMLRACRRAQTCSLWLSRITPTTLTPPPTPFPSRACMT